MGIEPNKSTKLESHGCVLPRGVGGVLTLNVEPSGYGSRPNQWSFVDEVQVERRPNGATSWTIAFPTFLQADTSPSCVFLEYEPLQ